MLPLTVKVEACILRAFYVYSGNMPSEELKLMIESEIKAASRFGLLNSSPGAFVRLIKLYL